jgi:1-acyl-sn-glycerol-3-phosphate acyltransferase
MNKKPKFLYKIGHSFSYHFFHLFYDVEVYGLEHVPKQGAFLLAANHVSFFDPFLIGSVLRRDIYYFARKTLFKKGLGEWLLKGFNAIPVDREGMDLGAMKMVFKVLEGGSPLMVFPEGTRTSDGKLQRPKSGVGMMACKAGVAVLPSYIDGAYGIWQRGQKKPKFRGKLRVFFGPCIKQSEYNNRAENKVRYEGAANRIMEGIEELESYAIALKEIKI